MLQESVYCRLLITPTMAEAALQTLKRDKPPKGLVMALKITEKQFQNMEILVGDVTGDVVDTDERLVVL